MTFESDLFPLSSVRVIPTGSQDMLDLWFDETTDEDWAFYFESIYDPD
jgi:hypothetical protein